MPKKQWKTWTKSIFLGFKDGKIIYKTQNLDFLDTPF
jgi:hypothetical protein